MILTNSNELINVAVKMSNDEIKAEYTSSLADLTFNSKPLINVLTILAEENIGNAADIVAAIEEHLAKVQTDVKLPILYLIDCIAKNIGGVYTELFSQNIVVTFCNVFKLVDEKTRSEMFKLRQTWNDIFPQKKLYAIDVQINMLDPAWPVTAQPPSNSIHFNPRFLTETPPTNMDTETMTMQQKLIEKQKELIELQQKKLKLELLQTQVKLQKQLKNNKTNPLPKNLLLKPEVAKQLVSGASSPPKLKAIGATQKSIASSSSATVTSSNQSVSSTTASSTIKTIRDPRLLRQHHEKSNNGTSLSSSDSNSNVSLGSKTTILDSNKVVANKMSVRDNRNEPRLIHNKESVVPIQNKSDNNNTSKSTKTFSKSRQSEQRSPNKRNNTNISSNNDKSISDTYTSTHSPSSSLMKNSVILLDSPTNNNSSSSKSKSDTKSPSKSPNRHKRKDYNSDKKNSKETKRDRDNKRVKTTNITTFKGVKSSTKNRNYIRRNRSPSYSPEPPTSQDVDFRVPVLEKQTTRPPPPPPPNATSDDKKKLQGMDVDLRQLPAIVSKKRSPSETLEQDVPKKNKTEMFDVLFGNEDTDLRKQLPVVPAERPPTPPPPIISQISNEKESPKKSTHLDAVRAKLASATGRDKIMSQSFRKKRLQEDEDLRILQTTSPSSTTATKDALNKIIISSDDEQCIKDGTMTKEQEKQLMNKIIAQIEHQKLREAQRKESNENIQTLSDDEIIDEDNDGKLLVGDKDDRVNFPKYSRDSNRDTRRGGGSTTTSAYWRGGGSSTSSSNSNNTSSSSIGGKRRHWENSHTGGPHSRPNIRPWMHQVGAWRPMATNFLRPLPPDFPNTNDHSSNSGGDDGCGGGKKSPEVPNDLVVDSVNQDDIKSINIDGVPRDIRYYDETAIVFMNWDDPREISFQDGNRHVFFDKEIYLLSFNEPYKDLNINDAIHKVRLGAPSREIFIDCKPYECYFGGPGITIDLDGHMTTVKLDGPPPQVKIGNIKRLDLVAGKVNLIIDAKILVPVFLDSKLQKFVIDGETHTLKFVDALKTVLINDVPFNVEFGGLPKPITVHEKKHFIRFSVLPRGIKPGFVNIKDMDGGTQIVASSNSPIIDETSQDGTASFINYDINEPALPVMNRNKKKIDDDHDRNSNSPHFFQNFMQQNNLDVLSSVMTSSFGQSTNNSGYQVENIAPNESSNPSIDNNVPKVNPVPLLPASININELFQKLVATGIVATSAKAEPETESRNATTITTATTTTAATSNNKPPPPQPPPPIKRNILENLKPITFSKPETLKIRQNLLYDILYAGMQCSSCGMRFPPEHSIHYSQHLDWHFRQNRKGKKNIRVAASRKWYYTLSDWKNFEEIEDLEEREKNYFDQQQQLQAAEQNNVGGGSGGGGGGGAGIGGDDNDDDIDIPSVQTDPNVQEPHCDVCQDKFDHFFNEEKEEWHLRNAIRVDNKTYHPLCYDDYQISLENISRNDNNKTEEDEDSNVKDEQNEETNIPGLEIILDDDDDDDEEEDADKKITDDQVLIEESDESKPSTIEKQQDESNNNDDDDDDEGDDDDVIINEVVPERIEVDDDDDDDYVDKYMETIQNKPEIKHEQIDDGFMDVEEGLLTIKNGVQIKIKSEPIDPDDLSMEVETPPVMPVQSVLEPSIVDTTVRTDMITTIDGNIELNSGGIPPTTASVGGKIKINISKQLPVVVPKETKDLPADHRPSSAALDTIIDPSQPLPPGEEPIQLRVKPALQGVELKKLPAVKKGSELTGMCSIM